VNTQGLHSSREQKDADWSVDKRVINSKKKVRETHGNILGVLSSAGKLCTALPSSHSQASTTSPALKSCRAKSPNESVPPELSVSRLGRRRGPFRLLLLDVLPASSCAQHQPQNSVRVRLRHPEVGIYVQRVREVGRR